jgi:hypothetical protein
MPLLAGLECGHVASPAGAAPFSRTHLSKIKQISCHRRAFCAIKDLAISTRRSRAKM